MNNKYLSYHFGLDRPCLFLNHSETHRTAFFEEENVHTILNRSHARAIRKKTGFKDIIAGDIFYNKLFWSKITYGYKTSYDLEKTGMAIVRGEKIIWYSMPGKNYYSETRQVIIEKIKKYIISGSIPISGLMPPTPNSETYKIN
jgi:hypothetical protein